MSRRTGSGSGRGASAQARERFYRLLRACCAQIEQLREPFEGAMECDETTFGGARKGKRGWGAAGKVIVFGLIKRNGQVKAMPIPAHDRASVMREIEAHTREGALYYTDEWQAYATLKLRGEHVMIRKEKGRPAGRDHINGIEGFWSYAKNWLHGQSQQRSGAGAGLGVPVKRAEPAQVEFGR